MERVTIRADYGILVDERLDFGVAPFDWDHVQEILARLAAYEDTGLTPEQIEAMAESAKTTPLPCKIGDEVWGIRSYQGVKHPQRGRVSEMYYTNDMRLHVSVKYICRGTWGSTVFSTYEEAEAALNRLT